MDYSDYQVMFIGLFVAIDDGVEGYTYTQLYGQEYPENCTEDIMYWVKIAREANPELNIVDMYGYIKNHDPENTIWFENMED